MNKRVTDLTGRKYGSLTVIGLYGKDEKGQLLWKCICDCGNEYIAVGNYLKRGDVGSCGCKNKYKPKKAKTDLERSI